MSDLIFNVHDIFDTSSRNSCLQQHGCHAYRIPPYQRGYKWSSETKKPVERLLNDLTHAWMSSGNEYLLQAITVKKSSATQVLEVIDGQQRLTTLFILLQTLSHLTETPSLGRLVANKLQYSIRHEGQNLGELVKATIDEAQELRENFQEMKKKVGVADEQHQDNYYLKCAVLRCGHDLRIDSEGKGAFQSPEKLAQFRDYVLKEVKLMVNAVEPHISGEEIFGNLNSNRVVLTETELIKGLILTRVAREPQSNRPRQYRETLELRIQLGRKWDELLHWADRKEIHSLYFPAYENGITGLLELVARQLPEAFEPPENQEIGEKPLFEFFFTLPHIEPVFHLLSQTHARLQDWFEDEDTYHLLGYCLMKEKKSDRLSFLADCLTFQTNSAFKNKLFVARKAILTSSYWKTGLEEDATPLEVARLNYEDHKDQITFILLALSIFQGQEGGRFDFPAYQNEKWSLEHIFPQTPGGKGAQLTQEQEKAALDILTQNEGNVLDEKTSAEIVQLRNTGGDDQWKKIEVLLKGEPILHGIGNLCLLSLGDNSAMGCGMFDEKRRVIRDRLARGSFVPRHTYEVFSRMIVGETGSLELWSKSDIEIHQQAIQQQLNKLMEDKA